MYNLTFDENGLLDFTQDNIELIETCISIDSRYRKAFDITNNEGSAWYIKNKLDFQDGKSIEDLCKLVDAENSTHLYVSGNKKGNNLGVVDMVKRISNAKNNIEERIKNQDLSVVDFLARSTSGIYKPSFASKFCTYVSRYKYDLDNYSIYDDILQRTIPYYAWNYLGEKYVARKNSSINLKPDVETSTEGKINQYEDYWRLIEKLIKKINEVKNLSINKEIFDHMLWYYYKGDETLIAKSLQCVVDKCNPLFI